jgi:hypothetical protein
MEKIVFGTATPEGAHKKLVIRGIVRRFVVIAPLVGFRPFCNQIRDVTFEEIVFDNNHFTTLCSCYDGRPLRTLAEAERRDPSFAV